MTSIMDIKTSPARRWAVKWPSFRIRLEHLGALSLASLLFGGVLLILIALNALTGPQTPMEGRFREEGVLRFRHGSLWSLQAWTAITGVGFSLLAYGYAEAYAHFFDWWCSRQARSQAGLDYGRYLNTLPRAPVAYGVRGFPLFATLRHFMVLLTVAASIGYKFGLSEGAAIVYQDLTPNMIVPSLEDESNDPFIIGSERPWFVDKTIGLGSYGIFQHNRDYDDPEYFKSGPTKILMTGKPCSIPFTPGGVKKYDGRILSREVILVAQKRGEEDNDGKTTMSRQDESWISAPTGPTEIRYDETQSEATWAGISKGERAVVQYRITGEGNVQIQWGKSGSWFTDPSSTTTSEPIVRRETYQIRYAVGEVVRSFTRDCAVIDFSIRLGSMIPRSNSMDFGSFSSEEQVLALSIDNATTRFNSSGTGLLRSALETARPWINTVIQESNTPGDEGVSIIVRAAMYAMATGDIQASRPSLRLLSPDDDPFGPENATTRRLAAFPSMNYPFFIGIRDEGVVGCYKTAAAIFIVLGILAVVTMIGRIIVGPAEITSWTAQHLHLARAGAISLDETLSEVLASGYRVAPAALGHVRIERVAMQGERKLSESESLVTSTTSAAVDVQGESLPRP